MILENIVPSEFLFSSNLLYYVRLLPSNLSKIVEKKVNFSLLNQSLLTFLLTSRRFFSPSDILFNQ